MGGGVKIQVRCDGVTSGSRNGAQRPHKEVRIVASFVKPDGDQVAHLTAIGAGWYEDGGRLKARRRRERESETDAVRSLPPQERLPELLRLRVKYGSPRPLVDVAKLDGDRVSNMTEPLAVAYELAGLTPEPPLPTRARVTLSCPICGDRVAMSSERLIKQLDLALAVGRNEAWLRELRE